MFKYWQSIYVIQYMAVTANFIILACYKINFILGLTVQID